MSHTGDLQPAVGGLAALSPDIRQITLDPENGDLYIADAGNHVIRKIENKTDTISTVAGIGLKGYTGSWMSLSRQRNGKTVQ